VIDELELVRQHVESDPLPSPDSLERLRAELNTMIEAVTRRPSMSTIGKSRRLTPRFRIALGAAAAALIALFLLPSGSGGPQPAAASELHHLAAVAAGQPATLPPAFGQFAYTDSEEGNEQCTSTLTPTSTTVPAGSSGSAAATNSATIGASRDYCVLLPEHRQIWIGADYSGRLLETFGAPQFFSPADEAAWQTAGSPLDADRDFDVTFGPHALADGPPNFADLPTNPVELAKMIADREVEGGPPGPAEDFTQIGDLLRETDASPALRSALYQVAATIPGIELLGSVADHAGTVAIGVAYSSNGVRNELFFDPSTSALVGEESVAVVDQPDGYDVTTGTILSWADYVSSGIVSSLSDTPTGSVEPAPSVSCTAIDPATLPADSMKPIAGDQEGWPAVCNGNGPN
jgi:hypothetical protein